MGPLGRGNMAAFTINDASQAEPTPRKNLLLRVLDALADQADV